MLYDVRYRSLCRADPPSRGVLPDVVCLSVIYKRQQENGIGPSRAIAPQKKKIVSDTQKHRKVFYCKTLGIDAEFLLSFFFAKNRNSSP